MLRIFTKPNCTFCDRSKAYLTDLGIDYDVIDISENPQLREWLKNQGHTTVPQFYVGMKLAIEDGWAGLQFMSAEQIKEAIEK